MSAISFVSARREDVRLIQALRRSIKGDKDRQQPSIAPKTATAIVPPKKVIRALYDYAARSEQELSFSRGDFFHVIGRENDTEWYEACNPALPDARGLVPAAFFQALGRTERESADGGKPKEHDSGYSESGAGPMTGGSAPMGSPAGFPAAQNSRQSQMGKPGAMVYGIVLYDFQAERADELEAKAGEAIIVIAQSNPEWFVAKPIGRLGGPGLIPVTFVEIRDMASNQAVPNPYEAIKKAGIPKVEEWKKMAAEYKNSSITLGKFEGGQAPGQQGLEQGMDRLSLQPQQMQAQQQQQQQQYQQQQQPLTNPQNGGYAQQSAQSPDYPSNTTQNPDDPNDQYGYKTPQLLTPISAHIPKYCFAEDKYWFVIEAELEDGRRWELSRYYEDFYDFQIALLTVFPVEAGNTAQQQKRSLPYMPGPVNYVTDAITQGRLRNLDDYVKNLLAQPPHISRSNLVKQFFAPREGDYEIDPNAGDDDEYRLSGQSPPSNLESPADPVSGQSSRNNLNGNGYPGLSSTPRQPGGLGPGQPAMGHQDYPQPSQTPLSGGGPQGMASMKVKFHFNGEVYAIRVPSDISFENLQDKICERLRIPPGDEIHLSYKDEATNDRPSLLSNNDLNRALERNEKLFLFVEQV
ncbi:related to bud emergence mediator BEM1 [Cephalotrichum gorgonifer]|uniref:Related to bud emergence mediator BEM1 n=1 Tax=Cephalotrichum gorgonifer TaxID=2041049 RepID=A0AAE8MSY6_9PEZI|nr:related to bud emergence mediator BEM1 [Cephalotrichum gorgonifer]